MTTYVEVTNTLPSALGALRAGQPVSVALCVPAFGPGGTGGQYEILTVPSWVRTDDTGAYTLELIPNADLTPADTFYLVTEPGNTTHKIKVPAGGPYWLGALLQDDPPVPPAVVGSVRYDAAQALTDAQKLQARENIGVTGGGGSGTVTSVNGQSPDGSGNVALTAAEVDAVDLPVVGAPAYYQFTSADVADPSSRWGAIPVHITEWTPEVDGELCILPPTFAPDDPVTPSYRGDNIEVSLWRPIAHGAGHWQAGSGAPVPNVDYPDQTAASAGVVFGNYDWVGDVGAAPDNALAEQAGTRLVRAGVTYAITVIVYDGLLHKIDLSGLYAAMYPLGGLEGPQAPMPTGFAKSLAVAPNGNPCWAVQPFDMRPYMYEEGDSTRAEGDTSHASGHATHAEGIATSAEGTATHAEGQQAHAEGVATHAEGFQSHAWRQAEHAEGGMGQAYQFVSHNAFPPVSGTSGTDPILIPIYGPSGTHGRVTIMTASDRWVVEFAAANAAASFATRTSGAVTVGAQAVDHTFGTSSVTWTATGDATGNVLVTPSAACDRYHWVELWEFDPNPN
jgi:hypothetical protein